VRLSLPRTQYATADAIDTFYRQVQPRLAALPGVKAVSASNVVPLNGYLATVTFSVNGTGMRGAPDAHYRMVSPDYFRTLGIALKAGRTFTERDSSSSNSVAIVNETFAAQFLSGRHTLGTHIWLADGTAAPREVEIVGVVGNVRHFGLDRETTTEVYVPIPQVPDETTIWLANNMYWALWTSGEPLAVAQSVRRAIAEVDPAVPASFVRSMEQWASVSMASRRLNVDLAAGFALLSLLLALVGIHAVSTCAVSMRTREMGVRAALGGTPRQLIRLVVGESMRPVAAGLGAGLLAAAQLAPVVSNLLFGIGPRDPGTMTAVAAAIATAALMASYVPARRAATVDPILALRSE
jgi:putative ABC transport system permease protein